MQVPAVRHSQDPAGRCTRDLAVPCMPGPMARYTQDLAVPCTPGPVAHDTRAQVVLVMRVLAVLVIP
jgi:hypothetical protein